MTTQQLNIALWRKDLGEVYRSQTIGAGSVALLQLLNLQLAHSHELVAGLSDDAFVQRGIAGWRRSWAAVSWRLGWEIRRLADIAKSGDTQATKVLQIWNDVARPVLEGFYPPAFCEAMPPSARDGIQQRNGRDWTDGGKSFGDAFASATLWNQAAAIGDLDASLGTGWATNLYRSWLTQIAHQLDESAPGEDPTVHDAAVGATVAVLRKLAEAPGALLRATGVSPTLILVGAGATIALVVWLASR